MSAHVDSLNAALAGRFRIERELGAGGMATVFLAEDLRHRRRVAIKVLHPELGAALGAERFLREIEVVAGLHHPHILPVHDSGAADGLLYYVMPFAEGESLRQRLEREKQLPVADAVRITCEVADALDHAHRRGVVHRDIKPENILLLERHAMVADFGIARAIEAAGGERLTGTGLVVGTPGYMSPEQTAGSGGVDGRSDLYSLGCVLYEMLAGQPPFTGRTAESLAHQHLSITPRPVTDLRPAVPRELASAIQRSLAKAAADRFGSAVEFGRALERREPEVSRASATDTAARPSGRGRRLALLAAMALAVTAVVLWDGQRREREPLPVPPAHARSEIAVLPLENLSSDGAHAYFADGLHVELLTQLSKVAALKVISRTSVMGYQGSPKPLRTIASELGVGSVVEGSVQVVGERLRVNVQLIDAATEKSLWAEHYERALDDAFAIQGDVAQAIVIAVGAAITSSEREHLTAAHTASAEAYRLYLQGNEYFTRPGFLRPNFEIAQKLLERALALDPDFALARATLSQVHGRMYWFRYDRSPARASAQRAEAVAALRLDPDLPQAHFAMGMAHYQGSHEYRRALDEFAIALKGMPNDADLWRLIGSVNRRLGNWDEVLAAFERARQLNPRNADLYMVLPGGMYQATHRYEQAARAFEQAMSLSPDLHSAPVWRGWMYVHWQGQLDTLRAALDRIPVDADLGGLGSAASQRAELLLWERDTDRLLELLRTQRGKTFTSYGDYQPSALFTGWAHQLRGDRVSSRAAFDTALVQLDAAMRAGNDDWHVHAARGLALAGLGRRDEALREASWLQRSEMYQKDAFEGPAVAGARARILAQAGEASAALDELERLLAEPSPLSVHTLRLDPRWDPIRGHARFQALLAKYSQP